MSGTVTPGTVACQKSSIEGVTLRSLICHEDQRGWLMEVFRQDEMAENVIPAMAYISQTLPGVARGPHEHREQTDCLIFSGPGDFKLYLWDARRDSPTFGQRETFLVGESDLRAITVPPGVVHAYKNIGEKPGLVLNAPNRLYAGTGKDEPVDDIRHENDPHSPYQID